jgi:uncharacterized protein (TIGR03663 family)
MACSFSAFSNRRYTFHYDPRNYHGPTLFYFAKLTTSALGVTDFAVRFVPAFFSIATILLMFSLRSWIGSVGALASAALVAVSPGAVYFGRYFIHESLLVCFTLAAVLAVWEFRLGRRPRWLFIATAAAALMFATKETVIIASSCSLVPPSPQQYGWLSATGGEMFRAEQTLSNTVI